MPTPPLARAAARHRRCAERLAASNEQAEAGYLIGLAAECALKWHLTEIGMPLRRARARRGRPTPIDPMYLHFPDLTEKVLTQGSGILAARVSALLSAGNFFNGWTVKMRYRDAVSGPNAVRTFTLWHQQAADIFRETGL